MGTSKMFSIKDAKAEGWLLPIVAPTIGVAMRLFQKACNKQGSDFNLYPQDYDLYEVGTWDDDKGVPEKGRINNRAEANKHIINGSDAIDITIQGGE